MFQRTVHNALLIGGLGLVSAAFVLAQSTKIEIPLASAHDSWEAAQSAGQSAYKLMVVTVDRPQRKQACRVRSFTADKLVCSRVIGKPRAYLLRQVLALMIPGDEGMKLPFVLGANAGLGAAIWGTVVLAAACPACAVATGIAAFLFFDAAAVVLIADDTPDRVIYLAPGEHVP